MSEDNVYEINEIMSLLLVDREGLAPSRLVSLRNGTKVKFMWQHTRAHEGSAASMVMDNND